MDFAFALRPDGIGTRPHLVKPLTLTIRTEFGRLAQTHTLADGNYAAYSDPAQKDPGAPKRDLAALVNNLELSTGMRRSVRLHAFADQRRLGWTGQGVLGGSCNRHGRLLTKLNA